MQIFPKRGWLLVISVLALSMAAIIHFRNPILHKTTLYILEQAGFAKSQISLLELGLHGLHVENVVVGEAVTLDSMTITWPWQLQRLGYVDAIHIAGLSLHGRLERGKFLLTGQQPGSQTGVDSKEAASEFQLSGRMLAKYLPGNISCSGCRLVVALDGVDYPIYVALDLSRTSAPSPLHSEGSRGVAVQHSGLQGVLRLVTATAGSPLAEFKLDVQLQDIFANPHFKLGLTGTAALKESGLQRLSVSVPALKGGSGDIELKLQAVGTLPLWHGDKLDLAAVSHGNGRGDIAWRVADLDFPAEGLVDFNSQGSVIAHWQAESLEVTVGKIISAEMATQSLASRLPASLLANFKQQIILEIKPDKEPVILQLTAAGPVWPKSGELLVNLSSAGQAGLVAGLQFQNRAARDHQFAPLVLTVALNGWQWDEVLLASLNLDGRLQRENLQDWSLQTVLRGELPMLSAAGWQLKNVRLVLPSAWQLHDGELRGRLTKAANLHVAAISGPQLATPLIGSTITLNNTKEPLLLWRGAKDPANQLNLQLAANSWPLQIKQQGGKPLKLHLTTPKLTISGSERQINWQATGGGVLLPDLLWEVGGLQSQGRFFPADSGVAEAKNGVVQGSLQLKEITSRHKPPLVASLGLQSRFRQTAKKNSYFIVDLNSAAASTLHFRLNGTHNTDKNRGYARLRLQPLLFGAEKLELATLSPFLAAKVQKLDGGMEIFGKLGWDENGLQGGELVAAIKELSATSSGVKIHGVNSSIKLLGPTFTQTPPEQAFSINRVTAGVPIKDVNLLFQLKPQQNLQLQKAALNILEARLVVEPSLWNMTEPSGETLIRLDDLQMEKINELIAIDGILLTGTLSGQLPLIVSKAGVVIKDGYLRTQKPGRIMLSGKTVHNLAAQSSVPKIAIKAMENFHYKSLALNVNRDISGETLVYLHAVGNNPNLDGGRPIELNLNLSGKLDQILRRILALKAQMEGVEKLFPTN